MALWTPAEITTALWLDAADSDTITTVSGAVSKWSDKSGNSRHFTQSTSGSRPAFESTGLNTKPTVFFNTNKYLTGSHWSSGNDHTFIAVVIPPTTGDRRYLFSSGVPSDDNSTLMLMSFRNDSEKVGYFDGSAWRGSQSATTGAQLLGWVLDSAASQGGIFRNGVSLETVTYSSQSVKSGVHLGARVNTGFSNWSLSRVSELIKLDAAASITDRQKIEGYLAHKWGLSGNLPSDHPYKGNAPVLNINIDAGRFTSAFTLNAYPWLSRYDVGHFQSVADMPQSSIFLGRFLEVGQFQATADTAGEPALAILDAKLSATPSLAANPAQLWDIGHFQAVADMPDPDTYRAMIQIVGKFQARAALSATPKRLVWWLDDKPTTAQRVYLCHLTGTPDLILPMSSFQFRLYDNGGSYLSIVVPNAPKYAAAIAARINGQIVIRQGYRYSDGTEQTAEMARAGRIALRYDDGSRNSSATLTAGGRITFSFDPGVEKRIRKLMTRSLQADGNTMLRSAPIFGLFPGDTVHYGAESFTVQRISVAVGQRNQTMDILV